MHSLSDGVATSGLQAVSGIQWATAVVIIIAVVVVNSRAAAG